MRAARRCLAALALIVLPLGSCGGDDEVAEGARTELGPAEGSLNLVALPGYVEDGSGDPALDWVTPFERRTGCTVSYEVASSPERVARLVSSGRYDGVAARGDVSMRLVNEDTVDPLNLELITNSDDLFEGLAELPSNTRDGINYGVPQGREANLLLRVVPEVPVDDDEDPESWEVVFDPELAARYPGRVGAYDSPFSIADAAIYLRDHEEDLGIENPYELDQEQFDAAVELLREQRRFVGGYWRDAAQNARDFATGATVAAPAWRRTGRLLGGSGLNLRLVIPDEGASGFADSWMIASGARHPNCMYLWMNHMLSPRVNAAVAEHNAQAPSSERACDVTADVSHCDNFHAADEELFEEIEYWTTPLRDCGDERGDSCKDYRDWQRVFAEIRGSGPR